MTLLTEDKTQRLDKAADVALKSYYSEVKKVLDKSDVILEVLDARDPLGSRSADVEASVIESGKRLVLLLNKIGYIFPQSFWHTVISKKSETF